MGRDREGLRPSAPGRLVELGDEVKDLVTGFKGIAVARTEWLHGCVRISVQPTGTTKEGKVFEAHTFDEPQLVVVKRFAVANKATTPPDHGPRDDKTALQR